MPTAPILVAFDTNWLIHHLEDTMCRVSDIAGRHADTSVLIPKEVLSELDRLKTRGKDQATRSSVSMVHVLFSLFHPCNSCNEVCRRHPLGLLLVFEGNTTFK